VHPDLSNNLAVWRNLWSDSQDLAETAYSFMASRLTDHWGSRDPTCQLPGHRPGHQRAQGCPGP
jgi:hypothetical protein